MKKIMYAVFFLCAVMLLSPLSVLDFNSNLLSATAVKKDELKSTAISSTSFKICNSENGQITEMSAEDYIFGVVAAEMPALYEKEALKAQAIAAYTFACTRKAENAEKDYDITTDPSSDQSFITEKEAREKWGEKAEEYIKKIRSAVEETKNYMITYNKKPIIAVYHAISSGKTESAKDVWDADLEYLTAVESEGDKLATNYKSQSTYTEAELKAALADAVELSGNPAEFFGNITRTASGGVKTLTVCKKELSGTRLRTLLNLRSSNFTVNYADNKFTFTVLGYGHGVGMSQNGADYMAKQGSDFKEILTHYYKGCKVEKIE